MPAKITNQMKADCIGQFMFEIYEACPNCALALTHADCLCDGDPDLSYMRSITVPWDTCKQIYKRMAKHEPILSDNFETALAALIEHHGADALTSLASVMRQFDISIELDHEYDMSSVTIRHNKKELYYLERDDDSIGFITANDIKPEK